jgi:hypothetical protein
MAQRQNVDMKERQEVCESTINLESSFSEVRCTKKTQRISMQIYFFQVCELPTLNYPEESGHNAPSVHCGVTGRYNEGESYFCNKCFD